MAQQAQTVQIPKRLPLIVEPANRGNSVDKDARLVNGYIEVKGQGENAEVWIYERPGLTRDSQPPGDSADGHGIFQWRGNIYSIFGSKLYKDGVAVTGTLDTTNGVYRFSSCLGSTPKLQMGNGVKAYNYDDTNGLVAISDTDFPSSFVKGWAYLNGTTYVMTPSANILGSDINAPADWNALNVLLAQIEPDKGKALAKQLVYVIALKEWTTEVFYDAKNASGSPLGRVEGAKANWGCLSDDSVREIDGALIWLGASRDGSPEIVMMMGLRASVISTKPIERLLEGADLTTVYSWTVKLDGHRFYVLTIKEENLTLAYDVDERMWTQWTDTNGDYLPIVDSCRNGDLEHLVQHETNGRIYKISNSAATDDGDLIQVDIYTPNFDGGTRRRKTMNVLRIISDQQAGSTLGVRTNDADYTPDRWSNFRNFDLSQKEPFITNCGTFTRRVHNFRHRAPVRMPRIQAAEMQIDIGTL